ncbi:MAG: archease [Thermotogaceae bacterium]|nr:archease [Thermotogaceae bacterium]
MIKELEHTADIAYEIRFKDLKELFCDIILLLRNHTSFVLSEEKVEEEYLLSENIEDIIFDVTNEMIYKIDSGWIPEKVEIYDNRAKVLYRAASVLSFPIKALTYHMLKVENLEYGMKKVKVVFDI